MQYFPVLVISLLKIYFDIVYIALLSFFHCYETEDKEIILHYQLKIYFLKTPKIKTTIKNLQLKITPINIWATTDSSKFFLP